MQICTSEIILCMIAYGRGEMLTFGSDKITWNSKHNLSNIASQHFEYWLQDDTTNTVKCWTLDNIVKIPNSWKLFAIKFE